MIRPKHSTKPERSGMAMVIATVMLMVLLTTAYAFFGISIGSQKRVDGGFDDQRALLLADAGLHEAYEALRGGGTGGIGGPNAPAYLGGGVFWVEATDLGNDETLLESTALIGAGRKALSAVVRYDSSKSPLFQTTLNSREQLTLNQGVVIDSFDSSKGTYASQATNVTNGFTHADMNGHARSNKDIVCNANVTILGDATPGPGYGITPATGMYISGSTTPSSEPFVFPGLTSPTFPVSPSLSVANAVTQSLAAGTYEFPTLSIGKDATLLVTGPATIVVDDFTGGKDASLVVDATAGPITFHVRNTYSHISGFEVSSPPTSATAVAFMIEGTQDVVFPSATPIRGAYYAPNADIVFSSNNECWGAFAANRIAMSNDMRFHFDEDLANHWENAAGGSPDPFEVLAWTDAEVEPSFWLGNRRDPLQVMGVNAAALSKPSELWEIPPKPTQQAQ